MALVEIHALLLCLDGGVSSEQCVSAGGAGEYPEVLLDGGNQDKGWCGVSVQL